MPSAQHSKALLITDADKHAAALREVRMRRRVYPGWISKGRMTQVEAEREIAVMEAIAEDYAPRGLFD